MDPEPKFEGGSTVRVLQTPCYGVLLGGAGPDCAAEDGAQL